MYKATFICMTKNDGDFKSKWAHRSLSQHVNADNGPPLIYIYIYMSVCIKEMFRYGNWKTYLKFFLAKCIALHESF